MQSPTTASWRDDFRAADALASNAAGTQKRARGKDFEQILKAMFDECGLEPRGSFRPEGEEVDGSIHMDGRTLLVEAKWLKDPVPASTLYQLRSKVEGKIEGTLGIFISMSGYSDHASDALLSGKRLNMILFDGDDIRRISDRRLSAKEALQIKLRAAGDAGTAYFPIKTLGDAKGTAGAATQSVVLVEGQRDARILSALMLASGLQPDLQFVVAGGQVSLFRLIDALTSQMPETTQVLAVVDDDDSRETQDRANRLTRERRNVEIIAVRKSLEYATHLSSVSHESLNRASVAEISEMIIRSGGATTDDSQELLRSMASLQRASATYEPSP